MKLEIKSNIDKRKALKKIVESAARQLSEITTRPNMSELQFKTKEDAEMFDFIRKLKTDNSILKGSVSMSLSEVVMMRRLCSMQRLEHVTVSCRGAGNNLVVTCEKQP